MKSNSIWKFACLNFFFFNDPAPTEIYTLSLHDALPILFSGSGHPEFSRRVCEALGITVGQSRLVRFAHARSEEHTSELQSQSNLVCRLLLEKKKTESTEKLTVPLPVTERHKSTPRKKAT